MAAPELETTLKHLRKLRPKLEKRGVAAIAVFGSVARGEAAAESDVDLLVEFYVVPALIEFSSLQRWLTRRLGRKVDLATKPMLRPQFRERALSEAVYA